MTDPTKLRTKQQAEYYYLELHDPKRGTTLHPVYDSLDRATHAAERFAKNISFDTVIIVAVCGTHLQVVRNVKPATVAVPDESERGAA